MIQVLARRTRAVLKKDTNPAALPRTKELSVTQNDQNRYQSDQG